MQSRLAANPDEEEEPREELEPSNAAQASYGVNHDVQQQPESMSDDVPVAKYSAIGQ